MQTDYRYIAVCDVLGFSALIKNNPLKMVTDRYLRFLLHAQHLSSELTNFTFHSRKEQRAVRTTVFSDAILLYTVPLSKTENMHDIAVVSYFFDICNTLVSVGQYHSLPLRLGVAFGETFIDATNGLFLGLPLVVAHELEMTQDWIGGACDISCLDAPFFETACNSWNDFIEYDIPLHNKRSNMWALNWPRWADKERCVEYLTRQIGLFDGKVKSKYIETLNFLEWAPQAYKRQVEDKLNNIKNYKNNRNM